MGIESAALARLMQLVSPQLPIGAYAWSQGQEFAVHRGWIKSEEEARNWICGLLSNSLVAVDVPVLARFYEAWRGGDAEATEYWSRWLRANRETAELRAEDQQLGRALARLLRDLGIDHAAPWVLAAHASLANLFALAAVRWAIPLEHAAVGYLYSWAENQAAAAMKLVPLGQTAGQRILSTVVELIPQCTSRGLVCLDEDMGFSAPRLVLASALHEQQYTRLFRS